MKLELGCGNKPTPGYFHHDRWKWAEHVDITWDLERLPWPWADGSAEEIQAIDVLEHLRLEVQEWMDECWRVLAPCGRLVMRLPAYDNPYSWRDPTHRRVFHPESFHYWCPEALGTLWRDFGQYYFGVDYAKWWTLIKVERESNDLKFTLQKLHR